MLDFSLRVIKTLNMNRLQGYHKNHCFLILINRTIEQPARTMISSELYLKSIYMLILIHDGDEWVPAFQTNTGLYGYLLIPFGLDNAPTIF